MTIVDGAIGQYIRRIVQKIGYIDMMEEHNSLGSKSTMCQSNQ